MFFGTLCRGDVRDIHVKPPLGIPPEHVAVDAIDACRGGRDVEVLIASAACDTVIDYSLGLVRHEKVASLANGELRIAVSPP